MSTVRMSELLEQARSFDSSKLKPQTTSWAPLQEGVNEAVSPEQQAAIAISKKNKSKNKDEETEIEESGHTDVASAITNVKVAMSALTKMSGELSKLSPEDSLPSWWTNKVAVAVDKLDGMADYLDAKVESVKLDELVPTSRHVGKSKKNKDMFAVFDTNGEEVKLFKDEDDAREYSLKNHDKLMGHDKKPFKKEEVEPDTMNPRDHVAKSKKNPDMFCVFDTKGNEVKLFKDKKDAEEYAIKNHEELMGHDKPKNVKEEVECDCDCGKSPCEKCGQDHHGIAEEVELGEGFSPKEIKMAIGVASDKRYAGGNMTGAAAAIDKIKKGLSDHPQVAAVLRRQNEEVELDEHKGTEPHKHPHPKDVDEASARADAMRAMRKGKTVDPADIDTDASDDDVKSASKNIIMQLRKSVSLRGNFPVEFTDKKKVKVSAKIAQAVQNKHNSMKKANDKEKFQAKVSKSYKDMLSALKENTILDKVSKKLKEIKNG